MSHPLRTGSDLFATPASPKPLREHQLRAVGMLRQSLRSGHKRPVLQLATGGGKTRIAAEIVTGALAKGNRVGFTVPAVSLINQTIAAFESEGVDCIGVMQANHPRTDLSQPVQIISLDTLARRDRPELDMVVVDECHRRAAALREWKQDEPGKVFVGLSATPWAKGMADEWDDLLVPVRMQELIEKGFLSPFRAYAPSHPDMSGVKIRNGDYVEDGAAEVMGGLTADIVTTWVQKSERRPTLVFAVNKAHAAQIQEQFAAAGIAMGYCDADTDVIEREFLLRQVERGQLAGIVNIGTLTTGVDAPFISCIVLARPTRSEMLFVQIVGRGLRTAAGKSDCIILDHADNHARLGFVTDIHHEALLTGKDKAPATRKEKGEAMPKECGSCGTLKPPKVHICPSCGFEPVRQSNIEVEDGELLEITARKPKFSSADKQRFYSELLSIARQRGRSTGWVSNTYRDKVGVWPRGLSEQPLPPSPETLGFVRHKDIAFAKRRGA
jgi:DNA repair protein RadD